jgi:hypothetical protein
MCGPTPLYDTLKQATGVRWQLCADITGFELELQVNDTNSRFGNILMD